MSPRRLDRHGNLHRRRFGEVSAAQPDFDDLAGVARHSGRGYESGGQRRPGDESSHGFVLPPFALATTMPSLLLTFENPADRPDHLLEQWSRGPVLDRDLIAGREIGVEVAAETRRHVRLAEGDVHFVVVLE